MSDVAPGMIADTRSLETAVNAHRARYGDGHFRQVAEKTIEECAELTQALVKQLHFPCGSNEERVESEMIDLLICLEFLGRHLGVGRQELLVRLGELSRKIEFRCNYERAHEVT